MARPGRMTSANALNLESGHFASPDRRTSLSSSFVDGSRSTSYPTTPATSRKRSRATSRPNAAIKRDAQSISGRRSPVQSPWLSGISRFSIAIGGTTLLPRTLCCERGVTTSSVRRTFLRGLFFLPWLIMETITLDCARGVAQAASSESNLTLASYSPCGYAFLARPYWPVVRSGSSFLHTARALLLGMLRDERRPRFCRRSRGSSPLPLWRELE